ncbi:MAG: hypothetical protein IJW18_08095 [Lachnospiraceae bacterium]|nr:hypothetical protein [Lachnospiraceae bacterium]
MSNADKLNGTNIIDLFLFMGQSNMAGRGITSDRWPNPAPALIPGVGFEFRAISAPDRLFPIVEPFGVNENNPAGINDIFSDGANAKTGSMVTAFCNAYYTKTSTPIVGISASKGGSRISQWQPDAADGFLKDTINRYNSAVSYLLNNNYTIRHRYMLWCQGESDGDVSTPPSLYKDQFLTLWHAMQSIGIEKCFLIKTGLKNVPGHEASYEPIRNAQEELCQNDDIIMVSRSLGEMLERGLMKDAFHYYQQAYNECGDEAGERVGEWVILL